MEGVTVGVFGTEPALKEKFESSIAKKSEAEGIAVFHRNDGGRRISFLDSPDFPGRVQGYAGIASISDYALYLFPSSGSLSAPDGELAVLLSAMRVPGTIEIIDGRGSPDDAQKGLTGTAVADFRVEERNSSDGAIDTSAFSPSPNLPDKGTLVYVDRAFTVKGVGTVALGFILSGKVSIHDQLRPIPGPEGVRADVRGIQVSDEDFESAGRGIRVGLALKGVEPEALQKSHWLDDGSFSVSTRLSLLFEKTPFYRQDVRGRDLHLALLGETLPASLAEGNEGLIDARLPSEVPHWKGMRGAVLDLNGKNLRIAGGAECRF